MKGGYNIEMIDYVTLNQAEDRYSYCMYAREDERGRDKGSIRSKCSGWVGAILQGEIHLS